MHKTIRDNGTGLVTLPVEAGKEMIVHKLTEKWGADSLRNSDGTEYSAELEGLDMIRYTTLCLARADQKFLSENPDMLQHNALMSDPKTATGSNLRICLLDGFLRDQFRVDDSKRSISFWQVFNRTTEQQVPENAWMYHAETGEVVMENATPFHVYTVNFWAYHIWDSTSMYNHISNGWTSPHQMPENPIYEKSRQHLFDFLERWCLANDKTDVVRLTSLFYHFANFYNDNRAPKYMDLFSYNDAASPYMLELFEKKKGYRLELEDLVDKGHFNTIHKSPSKRYLDFIDFVSEFIVSLAAELNSIIHRHGKKSMLFTSDHWIGAELYNGKLQRAGFDALVTACHNGTMYRRTMDAPVDALKEIRLQPYFFHNEFDRNGVPIDETLQNWANIRRAMLRNVCDRVGFGGYVSIPYQYPEYVELVASLCEEFRGIVSRTGKVKPWTVPSKVAVINSWGEIRSWQAHPYWYEKYFRKDFMESLAGLPVTTTFLSFDEILRNGIPSDVSVVLNAGSIGTSWSGGDIWKDPDLVRILREWVYSGGGIVGMKEPSAVLGKQNIFQLADVFGVDKEYSFTCNHFAFPGRRFDDHYLTRTLHEDVEESFSKSFVYAAGSNTSVLRERDGHVYVACQEYGKGRAVYLSDLAYTPSGSRLLFNALTWAARDDEVSQRTWFSENPAVDCAHYPTVGATALANVSGESQATLVYDGEHKAQTYELKPYELLWI